MVSCSVLHGKKLISCAVSFSISVLLRTFYRGAAVSTQEDQIELVKGNNRLGKSLPTSKELHVMGGDYDRQQNATMSPAQKLSRKRNGPAIGAMRK